MSEISSPSSSSSTILNKRSAELDITNSFNASTDTQYIPKSELMERIIEDAGHPSNDFLFSLFQWLWLETVDLEVKKK